MMASNCTHCAVSMFLLFAPLLGPGNTWIGVWGLSAPAPTTTPRPIQRVCIVGSGVAGLSVAHALASKTLSPQDQLDQVVLVDTRPRLDTDAGAGVQLNGGLHALQLINPQVAAAVQAAGVTLGGIQTKTRDKPKEEDENEERGQENDNDDESTWETILKLDLPKIVRQNKRTKETLLTSSGDLLWTCILRGTLQQTLMDTLPPPLGKKKIQCNKQLVNLTPDTSGQGILCHFADGSQEGPFDMVVGCDGVNSICKQFVRTGRIDTSQSPRQAVYAGLRIRYAVQEKGPKANKDAPKSSVPFLTQYLADGAYGLLGTYGAGSKQSPVQCAVSVTLDPAYLGPFRRSQSSSPEEPEATAEPRQTGSEDENIDWAPVAKSASATTTTTSKAQIPGPVRPTMEAADRAFELGVYYHNPFCSWSRPIVDDSNTNAMVVLCGDAAHAVPPFLGQGANQAIQDAYCLAEKIRRYNEATVAPKSVMPDNKDDENVDPSLAVLLKEYEHTRWPATFNVFWQSLFLGYLETGGPDGFYSTFRNIFFKTTGILGIAKTVLLNAATPKL